MTSISSWLPGGISRRLPWFLQRKSPVIYPRAKPTGQDIFSGGPILDAVQRGDLFKDSKFFVDMPLKGDPDVTLRNFMSISRPDPEAVYQFIRRHFDEPGSELIACDPEDWVSNPSKFDQIADVVYRQWAQELHKTWRGLCRKIKVEVSLAPQRYSLIYVPHAFIAPGGRFRELYYWDTYWIIRGLLASEMYTTARQMIENLCLMVRRFGFIPNGGRIYYLNRSQPPLLTAMVYDYFMQTNDRLFLRQVLPDLELEYNFWQMNKKSQITLTDGRVCPVFQYKTNVYAPRPESYREDLESAMHLPENEKFKLWSDIAAACESGWDFSSRWMARQGGLARSLPGMRTSKIVPVDLNAFMSWNERLLAELHGVLGCTEKSMTYQKRFLESRDVIYQVFWSEYHGMWFDYDLENQSHIVDFYASNPTPLFTGSGHSDDLGRRVLEYLKTTGVLNFPDGLPTSLIKSSQQWDWTNGWAPTNHMIIEALRQSRDPSIQEAAYQLAQRWINLNYMSYVKTGGKMFEKYNVEDLGSGAGGGGEYEVQEGFGWTNGVILDLLVTYGQRLESPGLKKMMKKKQRHAVVEDFDKMKVNTEGTVEKL